MLFCISKNFTKLFSELGGNSHFLPRHSEVCVHFSVSLSQQIGVLKVNLEVSGKVLDI